LLFEFMRSRKLFMTIGATLLIWMLSSVDTTFAQVNLEKLVTLPDVTVEPPPVATPTSAPIGSPSGAPTGIPAQPVTIIPAAPVTIDVSGVASVNAKEIALVSLAARQVQLGKTPAGARLVAKALILEKYKWNSSQISCLDKLWTSESHWNFQARNPRSGAHGIAQAMPGNKMEIIAMDWRTNPVTQIKWGLNYVKVRYGTPCGALAKKHRSGYY
jgi:hypothetical protein